MFRFRRPYLIQLHCFDKRRKLLSEAMTTIGIDKRAKNDEAILIILITVFLLLFFARSLTVFLVLLTFGLIIGIFGWAKLYKERRKR